MALYAVVDADGLTIVNLIDAPPDFASATTAPAVAAAEQLRAVFGLVAHLPPVAVPAPLDLVAVAGDDPRPGIGWTRSSRRARWRPPPDDPAVDDPPRSLVDAVTAAVLDELRRADAS